VVSLQLSVLITLLNDVIHKKTGLIEACECDALLYGVHGSACMGA